MKRQDDVTEAEIRRLLELPPDADRARISRVSSLNNASPDAIVFAGSEEALTQAVGTRAGLILAKSNAPLDRRVLVVRSPRTAFAMVYERFFRPAMPAGVHAAAVVEPGATLGNGSRVEAGAFIGEHVAIGENCWIGPRAVLLSGTRLGDRVRVQAGAVLGSDGFGYVEGARGFLPFPQIGTLEIGDDVEIGAGTTIDRGALEKTVIGRGTKIDNLVHIAHNCQIGEDVLIAAQAGIAGSCVIGDRAILGGQVGIGEHATVGEGVILGGQGGVLSHKRLEGKGQIFWGTPAQPVAEYLRSVAQLRRGR